MVAFLIYSINLKLCFFHVNLEEVERVRLYQLLSSCVNLDQISFSSSLVELENGQINYCQVVLIQIKFRFPQAWWNCLHIYFTQYERGSSILKLMEISFASNRIFFWSIGLHLVLRNIKYGENIKNIPTPKTFL